jgi:hypothetical protein
MSTQTMPGPAPGTARRLMVIIVGLAALVTLMLTAFALPSVNSGPHAVPVGVTGSQAATHSIDTALDDDQWHVTAYPDTTALTAAIQDRDVVGGLVVSDGGIELYTASAGAPSATAALTAVADAVAERQHATTTVHDLVPFTQDDPRGAGLSAAALPMILGSLFPAIVLTRLFPGHRGLRTRVAGVIAFSLVAGTAITAFLQFATGTVDGNFALTSLGLSLGMAALATTFIGLESLVGFAGIGIGSAVMMLMGNPLSALSTGPHWLPTGWSTLGQILPPGATGSLLRANAFFDGNGAATPALTLGAWVLGGLGLLLIADRKGSRGALRAANTDREKESEAENKARAGV